MLQSFAVPRSGSNQVESGFTAVTPGPSTTGSLSRRLS